jgi:hypothetical protein
MYNKSGPPSPWQPYHFVTLALTSFSVMERLQNVAVVSARTGVQTLSTAVPVLVAALATALAQFAWVLFLNAALESVRILL